MARASSRHPQRLIIGLGAAAAAILLTRAPSLHVQAQAGPCGPPITSVIACENVQAGNPPAEWDVNGAGSPTIQGFSTDISVNHGTTVRFKINTNASSYRIDIYRLGYYGGLGARKVATVSPSAALPQSQPSCIYASSTGLLDCGNWAESASWAVPAAAVSGVYIAKLVRTDATAGSSHITFIVRDDERQSAILFQTSDTTWQAYNNYGGNTLYGGSGPSLSDGRAYKVSYNRPLLTRGNAQVDGLFGNEFPMIRWLEANGFDVSYFTGMDSDRFGAQILQHRIFMSVGHDEYWSGGQRTNVEAARAAGVHLAFLSGNEIFWKTRWESSIDGSNTPYRTLVTYKETHANAKLDPTPTWTGTWRDPRFSPPADGGRPENALSGTIFTVNACNCNIMVPDADGKMRFWRNTSIATLTAGNIANLGNNTLGYEYDEDLDNGFRPPGQIPLSTTTLFIPNNYLLDNGSTYGDGTATHHLSLYRHSSGALVFGAGTIQWSWGLDATHDGCCSSADVRMQQAMVNLFADMGVQPYALQPGLTPATQSTDTTRPLSTISSPSSGSQPWFGSTVTITGTATDVGGVVGVVEVSADGGATWHRATGRGSWSYTWTPSALGPFTILSRAADDSGNVGTPGAGVNVTIIQPPTNISIGDVSVTEGNSGFTGTTFTMSLSAPSTLQVTVNYATANGTASAGSDYVAGTGLVTFAPGTTQRTIAVVVNGDALNEANETFFVNLSNPVNSTLNKSQGIGTIVNDDPVPALSINDLSLNEGNSGTTSFVFSATLTPASGQAVTVAYATANGTATAGADYVAQAGTLTIPAGAASGTITVPVNGDVRNEPNETFTLTLSNPGNATIARAQGAGTIVNDDESIPPTVAAVTPTSGAVDVGLDTLVKVQFSEAMDSSTITASTIRLTAIGAGSDVPGAVSYSGVTATITPSALLAGNTLYQVSVSGAVTDLAGNALGTNAGGTFMTTTSPFGLFTDTTTADFSAGTPDANTTVTQTVDGEVALMPTGGSEFSGTALPANWSSVAWSTGGTATVGGGTLSVNGARAFATQLYAAGRTLEFVATFNTIAPAQHIGLGVDLNNPPWAIFSTAGDGALYARTSNGPTATDTPLPGNWLGTPHRFRIDWNATTVVYAIDGVTVASHPIAITATMRPIMSDFTVGGPAVSVDWLHMPPYATAGTFLSRVIDSGVQATWSTVAWTSNAPAGTGIALAVREGNTATPDGSWTPFATVASPGTPIGGTSRYLQYRAMLTTSDPAQTPQLQSVRIGAKLGSTLSIADDTVNEGDVGTTNAILTVTLVPISTQTVTVSYATADGTAVAGTDYVAQAGTLTFQAGATTRTVTVPVMGNTLNQADKTFVVNLTAPTNATLSRAQGVGTIRNDDPLPLVSVAGVSVTEGNAGTSNAVFTVTLTPVSGQPVTVGYTTADGTAIAGSDYVAQAGTVTFAPGVTTRTVSVVVNGDTLNEANEAFGVTLSAPVNAAIGQATGTGTIVNDDPLPTLAIADVTGNEGQTGTTPATFTVTLTPASGQPVTVGYATADGSATAGSDYAAQSGTLTFAPGVTTRPITVAVTGDTTYEPDETFGVTLSNPTAATLTTTPATGTIRNDDAVPAITIADASVAEGNTGTTSLSLAVSLSNASAEAITVVYATSDGTAQAESDYQAQSGTLTFAPGVTTQNVTVLVIGDTVNEANETVMVTLSNPARTTIARAQATAAILNDDGAPALSITDVAVAEGNNGQTGFTFTVTLSAISGQTVTVNYATANGAALAPGDYTAQSGTLTFTPGIQSQSVTILVNGDALNEADEAFVVTLSGPINATIAKAQGTGTILNDDPVPTLSVNDVSLNEGQAGLTNVVFNVTLSAASGRTVTVNYTTANGSAAAPSDYTAKSGALTFAAGTTLQTITVAVNGDLFVEPNETFTLTLTAPTNAALGVPQGTATILNDDGPPTILARSPAPNATEVFTDAAVTVTFSQPMNPATLTSTSVRLRAAGASSDVVAVITNSGLTTTLTPSAVLASGTTFTMTVASSVADVVGNPLGANVSWSFTTTSSPLTVFEDVTAADFSAGTPDTNTTVVQLADGDVVLRGTEGSDFAGTALPVGWSNVAWNAGGTANVGGGVLTVNGARAYGNTLYPAGRAVEFVATLDATAAGQHVGLGVDFNNAPWAIFSTLGGGGLYARTTNGTSTTNTLIAGSWLGAPHRFRIDWNATTVVYAIDGVTVASHPIAITATMRPIVSDFAVGGPAVSVDWLRMPPYAAAGTFTSRVFDAGSLASWGNARWTTSLPGGTSVQMRVRQGATPTPDGTWATWTAVAGSGSPIGGQSRYLQYQASLTTTDVTVTPVLQDVHVDAFLGAGITITDVTVSEGDSGTVDAVFAVTVSGVVSQPVSVNYATADGTATAASGDYVATSGLLTFPVGTTSQTITVKVNGNVLGEANETFVVNLTDAVNSSVSRAQAVGTILNDDPLPVVSVAGVSATEGNAGTSNAVFTVTLTPVSGQAVTVGFTTADGTATAGSDYVAQTGTVTFAPGVTTRTVSVVVNGDTLNEANETFGVTLSAPVNAAIGQATGTGTIVNDDLLPTLAIADVTGNEGQTGTTPATFTVTLTPASGQPVTVGYATVDGSATAGSDYAAQSGTLTFAPGVTTRPITVAVTGDTTFEPDETFGVTLSNPTAATLTTAAATGTIRNDDAVPAITIADASVAEGNTGTTSVAFAVTLSNASAQPITVNYTTGDGTALAGSDYQVQSGTLTFAPGTTTQTVTVAVTGDTVNEANETFMVTLSTPGNATIARAQATGTILNDDGDTTPPTIVGQSPGAGAVGVPLGATVNVQFSKAMNPATLTTSTFRLKAAGATSDVPAAVSYAGVTATLTPSGSLAAGTSYQVTVSGTVADLNGNTLGTDTVTSFTTIASSLIFTDAVVADFTSGAPDANVLVGQIGDGDIILKPAEGSDFFGTALPTGWSSTIWATGGTATVASGQLTVNGSRAYASALFANNRSLEFVATFSATSGLQHVGLGVDFNNPPWAIFSTMSGGALYARTTNGTSTTNTLIAGNWLGVAHRFRVDWNATSVVYFIDGTQVVSHPIAITASMRPIASDFAVAGPALSVDWLRAAPYASAGSFLSRVIDAGSPATWGTASWTADLPAGTTLSLSVRRGTTPVPDGTWTAFLAIPASGSAVGGIARYVQYRVDLSTVDSRQTPTLKSVVLTANIP